MKEIKSAFRPMALAAATDELQLIGGAGARRPPDLLGQWQWSAISDVVVDRSIEQLPAWRTRIIPVKAPAVILLQFPVQTQLPIILRSNAWQPAGALGAAQRAVDALTGTTGWTDRGR
jgi:hypothetical protein